MDEQALNMSVRTFLKEVGITSQREIEKAVRDAVRSGRLRGNERLAARVELRVDGVGLVHVVEGAVTLSA
jgi:hypothetical protein